MQDYQDFEVLIGDAGSTDGSLEIINEYVKNDRRFALVSRTDLGQSDAIDKAFKRATGRVYCFLNSDDYFLRADTFTQVVNAFKCYPDIAVFNFQSVYVDEAGKVLKQVKSRYHPFDNLSWIKYRGQVVQPSAFWLREVYERCPFHTNWHYCFDSAFFYEAYQMFSFIEVPITVAAYRLHNSNKSVGVSWKRIAELAEFEQHKFGSGSNRARYLRLVANCVRWIGHLAYAGTSLQRVLYVMVNGLSLLSGHRIPNV